MRNPIHSLMLGGVFLLSLAIGLLAGSAAMAAPFVSDLTWEQELAREDGTPMEPAELAGFRVYSAVDGEISADPDSEHIAIDADASTYTLVLELMPRKEPYTVRIAMRSVDSKGRESRLSDVFEERYIAESDASPVAPRILRLEIGTADGFSVRRIE